MAIHKMVKVGGSYYEGQKLVVSSAVGDYVLDMAFTAAGAANALSVVPDSAGPLDTFTIEHMNSGTTSVLHTIAVAVPNVGKNAAWKFDFPALQKIGNGEVFRVTYTNTATIAMNVHVVLEQIH